MIPHRFPNRGNIAGVHLFWSSVLHLIVLTLLLTLPIYSGGTHNRSLSFWEFFVELRGEGKSSEKSVTAQKSSGIGNRVERRKETNKIALPKTPKTEEKNIPEKDSVEKAVPAEAEKDKEPEKERPVQEPPSVLEPPVVNPPVSPSPAPSVEERVMELQEKPPQMVEEKEEKKTPTMDERKEENVAKVEKKEAVVQPPPVVDSPNPPLVLKENPKEETGLARPPAPASPGRTTEEPALAQKKVFESHANESPKPFPAETKPVESLVMKALDNSSSPVAASTPPSSSSAQAETTGKTAAQSVKADTDSRGNDAKASGNDGKRAEVALPVQKMNANEKKEPIIGVPLAEALLLMHIKIEVVSKSAEMPDVATKIFKRAHPMEHVRKREKQKEIDVSEKTEDGDKKEKTRPRRIFSVAKADKGIYTVIMRNKGEKTDGADIIFTLYEKGKKERIKKYDAVTLSPQTDVTFKFLLPEGVFWDDGDRFSGSIEDSDSITKFNSETGLTWREEKED